MAKAKRVKKPEVEKVGKAKEAKPANVKPAVKKSPVTKYYMKDKFFNKHETGIKRKGKANVQAVSEAVDFKWMTVKGTLIKFEKGKAIDEQTLALFHDGKNGSFNQKDFYLIQK